MNITPNSFSDGGEIETSAQCFTRLEKLHKQCHIIDVGAESTAPMNQSVPADIELARFRNIFLPALDEFHSKHQFFPLISIDTYKFSVFQAVWDDLKKMGVKKVWWNDVSGLIESDILEFLKRESSVEYVFCHNRVPKREESGAHKQYADPKVDIKKELIERFNEVKSAFKAHGILNRLHFDPCFCFAKTREQNHELIKQLPEVLAHFKDDNWVLGISRKSFLAFLEEEGDLVYREMLHFMLLSQWVKKFSHMKISYRVHDPNLVLLVDKTKHLS